MTDTPPTAAAAAAAADTGAAPSPAVDLARLAGAGPRALEHLSRLGIDTVEALLLHLPLRYEDRTRVTPVTALRPGPSALVVGEVLHAEVRTGRRRSLLVAVGDGTGVLYLRFFHFRQAQRAVLTRGARVRCFGEVRAGPGGLEMVHPEYRILAADTVAATEDRLTPVYPTTEGLGQGTIRRLVGAALAELRRHPPAELVPQDVRERLGLPTQAQALWTLHSPAKGVDGGALADPMHPARRRLAFEELMAQHLSLRALRARVHRESAPPLSADSGLLGRFLDGLPFALTNAQARALDAIVRDLAHDRPMQRLLQGDVGSGKTVVAAAAAVQAVGAGYQAAVMAPTEILAEQHLATFGHWLDPLGLRVAWLSGKLPARRRRDTLQAIARHEADVVVGTHALFQEDVAFHDLGLLVVDEQHRFGVHQRLALREKGFRAGRFPHQLIMTATPIPRTLAMTAYADLDTTIIDELPPGRSPVETVVVPDARRDEVIARIAAACQGGRQAYWVCTLIEESEVLEAQAASATAEHLRQSLPGLAIALVHGRMRPAEKEAAMAGFKAGQADLLVATTVIEVGVDVPRASLMVIENAERLGLAQLHQLRGRVGRGREQSTCVLMYRPPLSDLARERLRVIRGLTSGFAVAEEDMRLRGPGEVLGTRQTGIAQFRVADLVRDHDLVPEVAAAAQRVLAERPETADRLLRRWIGDGIDYGHV